MERRRKTRRVRLAIAPPPSEVALKADKVPTKELLPIGEGAYQSADAVKQRTRDNLMVPPYQIKCSTHSTMRANVIDAVLHCCV